MRYVRLQYCSILLNTLSLIVNIMEVKNWRFLKYYAIFLTVTILMKHTKPVEPEGSGQVLATLRSYDQICLQMASGNRS